MIAIERRSPAFLAGALRRVSKRIDVMLVGIDELGKTDSGNAKVGGAHANTQAYLSAAGHAIERPLGQIAP